MSDSEACKNTGGSNTRGLGGKGNMQGSVACSKNTKGWVGSRGGWTKSL